MSGTRTEKSNNLPTNNPDCSLSDSGFSSSSSDKNSRNPRDKSSSPSGNKSSQQKSPRGGSERGSAEKEFFDDPFFTDRTSKFKKRFANRPRLSGRIFGNKESIFDNDNFVDDLKKRIQEEKKMFFDGNSGSSDPFTSTFGSGGGRPTSPVGGNAGRTGFPFEDLRSGARARFDDFANRHPTMFSTMRNQPPWNLDDPFGHHHGFQRERNNSGSSGAGSGASTASTGEERVIPIQIIRDESPKPPQSQQQTNKPSAPPASVQETLHQPTATGPQRCNTEPNHPISAEENRAARAQSAPPQNANEKFVSKLSIDTSDSKPQTTQMGGNCSKSPKVDPPTANNSAAGSRSIPIIIEGRKTTPGVQTANGSYTSGQTPPKGNQQAKVSRPAERSPTPPPKKPAPPKDPLAQVKAVLDEVKELEKLVEEFNGTSREDREYLILDEFLTRCLIKLDVVETDGRDDVRTSRKECIRYIQSCISKLEKRVPLPPQPDEEGGSEVQMETGVAGESSQTEDMEIGSQQSVTQVPLKSASQTSTSGDAPKMDVDGQNRCASEEKSIQPSGASGDQQPVKA